MADEALFAEFGQGGEGLGDGVVGAKAACFFDDAEVDDVEAVAAQAAEVVVDGLAQLVGGQG
ncbi:hypothetical protein GCM10020000_74660 [Streptomyces olivoverticillatus]